MAVNQGMPSQGGIPNPLDLADSHLRDWGGSVNSQTQAAALNPLGVQLPQTVLGQPMSILVGMIILLIIFKYASEHEKVDLDPRDLHIGAYNIIAVGLASTIFIVVGKALTTRYSVPGLTQFFNYI